MRRDALCLVDCTSFYVSAQRIFDQSLLSRPTVILSNNDGCLVALDSTAKALGLRRGMPYFQCKHILEAHHVAVHSSNYALYDQISRRVMRVLSTFAAERAGHRQMEEYSIDEAFLLLDVAPEHLLEYGHALRETILRQIGIPVRVTIATTRVLTKVAMEVARRDASHRDVVNLFDVSEEALDALLQTINIEDLWNVGPRSASLLRSRLKIQTGKELRYADPFHIRNLFGVTLQRVVLELNGVTCIPLEIQPKPKQGIMTALSFSRPISSKDELRQAVAHYAARSALKLRSQGSVAGKVSVFIHTNRFATDAPQYANGTSKRLLFPTNFTPDLIRAALDCLESIFEAGYEYRKAGVLLSSISPEEVVQPDLFGSYDETQEARKRSLMQMMDEINARWPGRLDRNMLYADGAIKLANIERPNGLKTSRILANAKKLRYA